MARELLNYCFSGLLTLTQIQTYSSRKIAVIVYASYLERV